MSEHVSHAPPTSEMDPEVRLRNMKEELIQNQLRTDRIEATLQAILNKLDTVGNKTVWMFGSFGLCIEYIF